MWSHSAQRGPCGSGGANFLLMMERRLLKCRWRWSLLAGGCVVDPKPATFYLFIFFFMSNGWIPTSADGPKKLLWAFCHFSSVFLAFSLWRSVDHEEQCLPNNFIFTPRRSFLCPLGFMQPLTVSILVLHQRATYCNEKQFRGKLSAAFSPIIQKCNHQNVLGNVSLDWDITGLLLLHLPTFPWAQWKVRTRKHISKMKIPCFSVHKCPLLLWIAGIELNASKRTCALLFCK